MEKNGMVGQRNKGMGFEGKKEEASRREEQIKQIREAQEKAYEAEKKRIAEQYGKEGESIEDLMAEYAKEDIYKEYLVNLAVLTCDQATLENFILPNGQVIRLRNGIKNRKYGELEVDENPVSSNGLCYATVRDTKKNYNVPHFWCNCKQPQVSGGEMKSIMEDKSCDNLGVCYHLMKLEERWSNMPMAEGGYLTLTDAYPTVGGPILDCAERKSQGITMTSVLFCRQGGIIYPVTSGQIESMEKALVYMDLYLQGEVSETEIEKYIIYVSQNCELPIAKIVSGNFQGWDTQDNFDKYILAWSYYWNRKISEGAFGNGRIAIRPDVVKAMIMAESSWGTDSKHNGLNDITQALVPGDYALWILSGYDPTPKDKSHFGNTEQVVWVVNEGNYMEASMRQKFSYYYDDKKTITITAHTGFGDGMGILQKKVISIIGESGEQVPPELANSIGEYLIHYDAVTPNMSIACGIAHLAAKIENANSEKQGVVDYNGGGAEKYGGVPYKDRIDRFLGELGYDDGSIVKPLQ